MMYAESCFKTFSLINYYYISYFNDKLFHINDGIFSNKD